MKPQINLINIFEKVKDENGQEYFSGTLDLRILKKTKRDEIRVVFMTGDLLPESLHRLIGKDSTANKGLFMFAETPAQAAGGEGQRTESKSQQSDSSAQDGPCAPKTRRDHGGS
jgi:hypothetical protein